MIDEEIKSNNHLRLPFGLSDRAVGTQAINTIAQGGEVGIDIPEATSLVCAAS